MSRHLSDAERKAWIERRAKESFFWWVIHTCGSLRIAMVLLITIAAACAIATLCESNFNTKIAQAYIYHAVWFLGWLTILCLNLACAAISRWPWQRKHLGFVITHGGIITLLIGAMIGQWCGFEGSVNLHTGDAPSGRLVLDKTILQVDSSKDAALHVVPFDVEVRPPTTARPKEVKLPDSELKLVVDNYTEKLVVGSEIVPGPEEQSGAGVALSFASSMMGQAIPVNLVRVPASASSNEFFGRAQILWLDALPDRTQKADTGVVIRETQVILAQYPDSPVVNSEGGHASGYSIHLVFEGSTPQVAIEAPSRQHALYPLKDILRKPVAIEGEAIQVTVQEYWPDFQMHDGKPVSVSDQPNNPAIMVTLIGSTDAAGATGVRQKPVLELAPADATHVAYQVSRGGVVSTKGTVAVGEAFPLGWADWRVTIKKMLAHAVLQTTLTPSGSDAPMNAELVSGIHARLRDPAAKEGEPAWIPSGRAALLQFGETFLRVGFGLQTRPLPFVVGLEKFEVPRDEGTDTPSDFISSVRFTDPQSGETSTGLIHMNHPASFPPAFWRTVLGWNYKFSQASWDPNDLGSTTLQVLHDPGWFFKWVGSLLICSGIAVMFYFKPSKKRPAPNGSPNGKAAASLKPELTASK